MDRSGVFRTDVQKTRAGQGRFGHFAAAVLALLLSACAPATTPAASGTTAAPPRSTTVANSRAASQNQPASVLRIGLLGTAESLDPRSSASGPDLQVMFAFMEPLLTMTPASELQPHLATGWTVAEDGRSIRLELRDGVRFHDGAAFTSADVKFTLESADDGDGYGPVDYLAGVLDGVDTPDPSTAIIRFNQPAAFALYDLALIPMMPAGAKADFGALPIGTGPYVLGERSSTGMLTARRFDDYWGADAGFDNVEFHRFGFDALEDLVNALARGQLDLAQVQLPVSTVRQLASQRNLAVSEIPGTVVQYAVLNTTATPLDDPRVRSAIDHLIPRERIVEEVFGGYGTQASTVLGRPVPWSEGVPPTPFEPQRAQALLAEAGVRIDRPLTLVANAGNRTREAIAERLEEAFAQHGITLQTEFVPFREYLDRSGAGDFDVLLSGVAGTGNPVRSVLWAVNGLSYPSPEFADPRVAELATEIARLDVSRGLGADALRELLGLLQEEAAYAYLHVRPEVGVKQANLTGWEPHPVAALAYQGILGIRR